MSQPVREPWLRSSHERGPDAVRIVSNRGSVELNDFRWNLMSHLPDAREIEIIHPLCAVEYLM
jgi:hypothetical protein